MGFAFLFIQANGCEESAASEVAPARSTTGRSMSFNSLQVIVFIHIEPVRSNCIRLCCMVVQMEVGFYDSGAWPLF